MGKGKKRDNRHHNASNQEGSHGRRASVKKANPPAQANSIDRPKTTNSTTRTNDSGNFSKRKIISNWDRYSEDDVSSKITEEKLVQRLSQLLEQSVLQTSQSDFQPSLDALRDINIEDDNEDIFTHTFDIDYDKLADHISSFPIHKRLDLNPLYCQDTESSGSVTERNGDITLEMYPLTSETHSSNGASNISEHISSVTSLCKTEKKLNTSKEHSPVNATPLAKDILDDVIEDEDQLLTQLLAAKMQNKDKMFKMTMPADHTKPRLPEVTDEENDSLLEELLAQPI